MKKWLKVFFLYFLFGLLIYFNSLNNKFLLDDYAFLNNPIMSQTKYIFSQWNPYREQALGNMNSEDNPNYYRPMAHMVLDFCYSIFKNNYWQYHLLNLFLFVFASALIYLFIFKLTGNYYLAFLSGLFYLIHPINGIIVNYISAVVFAFQVIFIMSALLFLIDSLPKNNWQSYALSLVCSFISLFWNESGIMVPIYLCAFVFIFRKDSFKSKVAYLSPYFLIILSFMVFRFFFLKSDDGLLKQISYFHLSRGDYLASVFHVFVWYIGRLFYPQGIVMQYVTPVVHEHIILNVIGLFLFFAFFILLFMRFAKEKILQLAVVWIVIGFVPVFLASILKLYDGVEIEPHWFVFSSIGFFILAAYCCLTVFEKIKKIGFVLVCILILAWGSVSHAYNQLWADQKTYALYWSQEVPSLKYTYYALAYAYQNEGAVTESKKYYRMALRGYSTDQDIYNNLGIIDLDQGNFKEAEFNFKKALEINPDSAEAYDNLGAICLKQGQWKKAGDYFDRALACNPLLLQPRIGLANIYLNHSEYKKAIALCLINYNIDSDDSNNLLFLIQVYIQEKDFANIQKYATQLINIEADPKVLTNLGVALARNNVPGPALDCFTKVLHVAPDYKDVYLELGTFLAKMGKFNEAINIWKLGSSIDPSDQRFKGNIAKAQALRLK